MAENFDLIFGQSASQQYGWSDSDYQEGWESVGSTPPTADQFDALQRRSDTKAKELNDRLTPLETLSGAANRQPSTTYDVGDVVTAAGLPGLYYLECVVGGTTDAGAITLPVTLMEGATIVDGTVTWCIIKVTSYKALGFRQPSTAYAANDIAYYPGLPTGWYLSCKVAGTTSNTVITLPTPMVENAEVTDGTVVWTIREVASTADIPAPVDINGKADITGANMVYHKDIITTSGTYTAPVTGLYKITIKGGGGGGGASYAINPPVAGGGGGEGGTTIVYKKLTFNQSVSVTIGAGGTGGPVGSAYKGGDGGNSSVTISGTSYTAGGGEGGEKNSWGNSGAGGTGTIPGVPGVGGYRTSSTSAGTVGGSGGGAGGGFGKVDSGVAGINGGGGAGGGWVNAAKSGGAGGNGYVWFEYYMPGSN